MRLARSSLFASRSKVHALTTKKNELLRAIILYVFNELLEKNFKL